MRRGRVVEAKVDRVRLQLQPSEQRPRRVVERHDDKLSDPQREEADGKILDEGRVAAVGVREDQAVGACAGSDDGLLPRRRGGA